MRKMLRKVFAMLTACVLAITPVTLTAYSQSAIHDYVLLGEGLVGADDFETGYTDGYIPSNAAYQAMGYTGLDPTEKRLGWVGPESGAWPANHVLAGDSTGGRLGFRRTAVIPGETERIWFSFRTFYKGESNALFEVRNGANQPMLSLQPNRSENLSIFYTPGYLTKTVPFPKNQWNDMKICYSFRENKFYLYVNGVLADQNGLEAIAPFGTGATNCFYTLFRSDGAAVETTNLFDDFRVCDYEVPVVMGLEAVRSGSIITASFSSVTASTSAPAGSRIQWYAADDENGTNWALLPGENEAAFSVTAPYEEKYLKCSVTPVDGNGVEGITMFSAPLRGIGEEEPPIEESDIYIVDDRDAYLSGYGNYVGWMESSNTTLFSPENGEHTISSISGAFAQYPVRVKAGYYDLYFNNINNLTASESLMNLDDAIRFDIGYAGGAEATYRNPKKSAGWVKVGTYGFSGSEDEFVKVSKVKESGDPNKASYLRVDAIKLVKRAEPELMIHQPVVTKDGKVQNMLGLTPGNFTVTTKVTSQNGGESAELVAAYYENGELKNSVPVSQKLQQGDNTLTAQITIPNELKTSSYLKIFVRDQQTQDPLYEDCILTTFGLFRSGDFGMELPTGTEPWTPAPDRSALPLSDLRSTALFYPDYDNPAEFQQRSGMPNVTAKLESGQPVSIAYVGGSITFQNGWRPRTTEWLRSQYSAVSITEIPSAISGTGSDLAAARFDADVLQHNPDLIFIEFAVNDNDGTCPASRLDAMEGLVRKTWEKNPHTDLCFVYTIQGKTPQAETKYYRPTDPEEGFQPTVTDHETVAEYYNVPSINFGYLVAALEEQGDLIFKTDTPDGKIQFSEDGVHPLDGGHQLYAGTVARAFLKNRESGFEPTAHSLPAPLSAANWEDASSVFISDERITKTPGTQAPKGLTGVPPYQLASDRPGWTVLPESEYVVHSNKYVAPSLYLSNSPENTLTFTFRGRGIGIFDVGGRESGQLELLIDGVSYTSNRFFSNSMSRAPHYSYVVTDLEPGEHTVTMRLSEETLTVEEKLRKLTSKPETITDRADYDQNVLYLGRILLLGEIVQGGGPEKLPQSAVTLQNVPQGKLTYGGSFTVAASGGDGTGAYVYHSTDRNVAEVNSATGEVTLVGVGTFQISAYREGDADYNRSAAAQSGLLQADALQLTVTAPNVTLSKVYDGTDEAAAVPGELENKVGQDEVILKIRSAAYDNKEVGTDKIITVKYEISGKDAGNYIAPEDDVVEHGEITERTQAGPVVLGYEGTYDGLPHGITVTMEGAQIRYGTQAEDCSQTESPVYTKAGSHTVYYQVTKDESVNVTGSATVVIHKKAVTVTAADQRKTYGEQNPSFTVFIPEGALAGTDTQEALAVTLSSEAEASSPVGSYAITGTSESVNYEVTLIPGTLTVSPKTIDLFGITGVAPSANGRPVPALETEQYTAAVSWTPATERFDYSTVYTAVITLTPKENYTLAGVAENAFTVDGVPAGNAAENGVLTVVFPKTEEKPAGGRGSGTTYYSITVVQSTGGRISPDTIRAAKNSKKIFTVTPAEGYEIQDVLVDGKSVGKVAEYTYQGVEADSTITAHFKKTGAGSLEPTPQPTPAPTPTPTPTPDPAGWENPFDDVTAADWFYEAIRFVKEKGWMNGTGAAIFAPETHVTRGMFVTVLYRMEKEPAGAPCPFTDVEAGAYYEKAIGWANANQIVSGVSETEFAPEDRITREQMAVMLWRYAGTKGIDMNAGSEANLSGFQDADRISAYGVEAMQWAYGSGLINGKGGGLLDPQGDATRAETAAMLQRIAEKLAG